MLLLFLTLLLVLSIYIFTDHISANNMVQSLIGSTMDSGQMYDIVKPSQTPVGEKIEIWNSGVTTNSVRDIRSEFTTQSDITYSKSDSNKTSSTLPTCSRINHLYFLKIHKSGSTTVQNIFLRYSMRNNLNVMTIFPKNKYLSFPHRSFDHLLPPLPNALDNGKYDVYCEHSIYDEKYLMSKLHSDTVNIAIIREPFSRAQSAFKFFNIARNMGMKNNEPFSTILDDLEAYDKITKPRPNRLMNRIKDVTTQAFGCDMKSDKIEECLSYLESKFLVLIMEKMSESLVLMKRKLCWKFKDILCAHTRQKNYTRVEDKKQIQKYKQYSPLDFKIYDHFSSIFDQLISEEQNNFNDEVAFLDNSLYSTQQFCDDICDKMGKLKKKLRGNEKSSYDDVRAVLDEEYWFEKSQWEDEFSISGLDCIMMRFHPHAYRKAQKVKLFPEFCTDSAPEYIKALNIKAEFCEEHFNHTFPWSLLKNPRFVAPCY